MSRPPFYRRPGSGPIHPVDANVTSQLARQTQQRTTQAARSTTTTVVTTSSSGGGSSSPTSYTANAPLLLTGRVFSIPPAAAGVDGYLLGADWTTFNGKEPALGNPAADGYLLSSTAAGVRSWVAPPTGGSGSGLFSWMTPPSSGDWTWLNQSTATTGSSANGGFWLRQPAQASAQLTGFVKAQPATPYTIDFGVIPAWFNIAFVGLTIGWRDSGSGKIAGVSINSRGGTGINALSRHHWTSPTVFGADNDLMADGLIWGAVRFVRLTNDGSTLAMSASNDGVNYLLYSSEAVGAYLTPTDIYIGVWTATASSDTMLDFVHYAES